MHKKRYTLKGFVAFLKTDRFIVSFLVLAVGGSQITKGWLW